MGILKVSHSLSVQEPQLSRLAELLATASKRSAAMSWILATFMPSVRELHFGFPAFSWRFMRSFYLIYWHIGFVLYDHDNGNGICCLFFWIPQKVKAKNLHKPARPMQCWVQRHFCRNPDLPMAKPTRLRAHRCSPIDRYRPISTISYLCCTDVTMGEPSGWIVVEWCKWIACIDLDVINDHD